MSIILCENGGGARDYVTYGISQFRGVATYTQKRKCVHIWNKNMGIFNHSSDDFFMLCVQNVPLISLNPILTELNISCTSTTAESRAKIWYQ